MATRKMTAIANVARTMSFRFCLDDVETITCCILSARALQVFEEVIESGL
jgi:hypothetical protein